MEVPSSTTTLRPRGSPPRQKIARDELRQRNAHDRHGEDEVTQGGDVVAWLGKVLDSVRLRYRKLQRYAR